MPNKLPYIISQTLGGNVPTNTTKTAQFTPGPWVTNKNAVVPCIYGPDDNLIATIHPHRKRDINLVAAAPAMYEALQQSLVLVELAALEEWGREVTGEQQPPTTEARDRLEKVKAALAQAEGRQA